jgi:hypothetical protein
MKNCYTFRSERYGRVHKFEKSYGNNNYILKQEEPWMLLQITRDESTKKLRTVDPEGGPILYEGWTNGEIVINEIYEIGTIIFFSLSEVKNDNPQQ